MVVSTASLSSALRQIDEGVRQSEHPTSKVMAMLILPDGSTVSSVNYFPSSIVAKFGQSVRIGNRSGSIHAEVAALTRCYNDCSHGTNGASMVISDPPCMDCALTISLAGIKNVYIHPDAFRKYFAINANPQDLGTSSRILEYFGVHLFLVSQGEKKTYPIALNDKTAEPRMRFQDYFKYYKLRRRLTDIESIYQEAIKQKCTGCAIAQSSHGDVFLVLSHEIPEIPFTHHKYDISANPLAVLMGGCQRHGLRLIDGTVQIDNRGIKLPTRTLLDFLAGGHQHLLIHHPQHHPLITTGLISCCHHV